MVSYNLWAITIFLHCKGPGWNPWCPWYSWHSWQEGLSGRPRMEWTSCLIMLESAFFVYHKSIIFTFVFVTYKTFQLGYRGPDWLIIYSIWFKLQLLHICLIPAVFQCWKQRALLSIQAQIHPSSSAGVSCQQSLCIISQLSLLYNWDTQTQLAQSD